MDDITRRAALKTIAALGAPGLGLRPSATRAAPPEGPVPATAPRFFTASELATVDQLAERIIPADESSPGARAARVAERIDRVLHEGSDPQRTLWREGLAELDRLCRSRLGTPIREASEEQQEVLLTELSRAEDRPQTPAERLFRELKGQAIDAYYTSAVGLQELRYRGNAYLADFPGCTHPEHRGPGQPPPAAPAAPDLTAARNGAS